MGECWPFKGAMGFIVIRLSVPIRPTSFTMEHLPKHMSPDGRSLSAPSKFTVLVRLKSVYQLLRQLVVMRFRENA